MKLNPLLPISLQQLEQTEQWLTLRPLSSNTDMLLVLQLWVSAGWLRPLDHAFTAFLAEQEPTATPTVLLAAALTSYQLSHGHVCLDLALSIEQPAFTLSLSHQFQQQPWFPSQLLKQIKLLEWQQAIEESRLVSTGEQQAPLVWHNGRLYLWRFWYYEKLLTIHINQRLNTTLSPPKDLSAHLNKLFTNNNDKPDWQKIACAVATRTAFSIITGGPGTGKTTTVIRLLALLQTPAVEAGKPLNIQLAAPTGKAAARLSESIGMQVASLEIDEQVRSYIPTTVSTLHRLLGSRPDTRHFRHNKNNPLALDILIIDEASMIDLELFAHLLEALPTQSRLILLGDKDQLASVEAGAVLGDLCRNAEQGFYSPETLKWLETTTGEELNSLPLKSGNNQRHPLAQQTVMLRHSRRFASDSGIGQLAQHVNTGNIKQVRHLLEKTSNDLGHLMLNQPNDKAFEQFILQGSQPHDGYHHYLTTLKKQRPHSTTPAYDPAWKQWANQVLNAFNQFQVLAVLREGIWGVSELNKRIAYHLYQNGYINHFDGWYEGRPVLITHNDYALGLMNGDVGITLAFPVENAPEQTVLKVVFPYNDGTQNLRDVLPSRLSSAETVFAMTVHKSQGSEFSHTALILPDQLNPVLSRELLYTAITRARHKFTLIESQQRILDEAIKRQTVRLSGLAF